VTCNVVDDKAQTATATTSVMVEVPVAAPKPLTSGLCAVHFDRDARRPVRVDNEGKACLDEVALDLQRQFRCESGSRWQRRPARKRAAGNLLLSGAVNTKGLFGRRKGNRFIPDYRVHRLSRRKDRSLPL